MFNYNTTYDYFSTVFIYNYSSNIQDNFIKINYLIRFFYYPISEYFNLFILVHKYYKPKCNENN